MSKSAQDQIFERMWERIAPGEDRDDPFADQEKITKFDNLKYRIESLTTIISAYKDTDVGTVLNPDFSVKAPSWNMGYTAFWSATRAILHAPSIASLAGTMAFESSREEFIREPETWQALLARGDDFVKFLDVNKDFVARLLSKSTGLDPVAEAGKTLPENLQARVVSENVIPLIRNIIEAAKNDHMALGAVVSEVIMPLVKPEKGKALDVSQLLGKLAELKVGVLSEVLSSPENAAHLGKIAARSFDVAAEYAKQQEARVEEAEKARARIDELSSTDLSAIMASPAKTGLEASKRIAEAEKVGKKVDPRDVLIAQVAQNLPMIEVLGARDRVRAAEAENKTPTQEDLSRASTLDFGDKIAQTLNNGIISREQIQRLAPLTSAIMSSVAGTENFSKILTIGDKLTKQPPEIDLGGIIGVIESTLIKSDEVKKAVVATDALSVFAEIAKAAIAKPLPKVTKEKLDEVLGYASQGLTLLKENPDIVSAVAKFGAGALLPGDENEKTREGIVKIAGDAIPVLSSLVEDINKTPKLKGEVLGIVDSVREIKIASQSIADIKKAAGKEKKEPDEKEIKKLESQKIDKTKDLAKKAIGFLKAEKSFVQEKLPTLIKNNHATVAALLKPQIDKVPALKGTTEKLTHMLEDPKILTQAVDIADNYLSGNKFKAAMQGIALFATSKKVRSFVGSVVFNAVKEKFKRKPKEEPAKKGAESPEVATPTVELTKPSVEVAAPETVVAAPVIETVATKAPTVSEPRRSIPKPSAVELVSPLIESESVPPAPSIDRRDAAEAPPSPVVPSATAPKVARQVASAGVGSNPPERKGASAGVGPTKEDREAMAAKRAESTTFQDQHPPKKRGASFAETVKAETPSTGQRKGA